MNTRLVAFAIALSAVPRLAAAQVIYDAPTPDVTVAAPPAPVYTPPPPPVYAPPPAPVYVPPPPRVYAPPPPRVYYPPPPRIYIAPAPHVYIRERVRWHIRRAAAAILGAVPPPACCVVAQAAPPPPPTYYYAPPQAPLPPIPPPLVAPAPCCVQPIYPVAPPPPPAAPAPQLVLVRPTQPPAGWTSRIGLGVRGTGQVVNDNWNNLGIGGEFLYRMSPHWSMELAAEYQKNTEGSIDRMDIPATIGFRLHIGKPTWVLSPYLVDAIGFDYAQQDLKVTKDEAYYFDGQVGGGLELRLGQHVAITADARLDGKKRVDEPAQAVVATSSVNGKRVHALGDEYGGQFRLGVAVYF
jgi:hypothetical protein